MELIKHDRYEPIDRHNMRIAVQIRANCYLKDYSEILPEEKIKAYTLEEDLKEIEDWFFEATEDVRRGYIYYRNGEAVGMVIASLGEDTSASVEVNYLFVSEHARGHQVGKKLLIAIGALYSRLGIRSLYLYNWRLLKSNQFYRHIGGDVVETLIQTPGGKALETDKFQWQVSQLLQQKPVVMLYYFSGTGGTEWASEIFERELFKIGKVCMRQAITRDLLEERNRNNPVDGLSIERLVLMYPVYAFDAPSLVYDFLNTLEATTHSSRATVVSVSGGGEVWPNTKCRTRVIEKLEKLGYAVDYERMLVMPPNMALQANPDLISYLMQTLPKRVRHMAKEHQLGIFRRVKAKSRVSLRLRISDAEKRQVNDASRHYSSTDQCTSCGWCAEACPGKAIEMVDGRPKFKAGCQLCLRCYYGCPAKAIESKSLNRWLLKRYNLAALKHIGERRPKQSVSEAAKGLFWIGVKAYLNEDDHI